MNVEDLYYKDKMKKCSNCYWKAPFWNIISGCNFYPLYTTSTALDKCKMKEWEPNQKMYDYNERQS